MKAIYIVLEISDNYYIKKEGNVYKILIFRTHCLQNPLLITFDRQSIEKLLAIHLIDGVTYSC